VIVIIHSRMVIITMISPGSAVILSLYLCYLLLFIVEVVGLSQSFTPWVQVIKNSRHRYWTSDVGENRI
jgi:hypothetical protein